MSSIIKSANQLMLGGSFGIVYKAIEIATGEIVAIKHVSSTSVTYDNRRLIG